MRGKITLSVLAALCVLPAAFCACGNGDEKKSFEVSELVTNANAYMRDSESSVDKSRKNTYHLTPPVGWINDPNGFSEFGGKVHLFYQYNPYSAEWGTMHWGHQTTKDFVKWELQDVALAPDMDYDKGNGCFSGTAITVGDAHYLVYTAADAMQNQALAYSYDGVTYKKLDNLLIDGSKDLPEGFSNADFRDPKIFERGGKYYILCGNRAGGSKQIVMFGSDKVDGPYEYKNVVYSRKDVGGILECPDLAEIGGKDVLLCSPQSIHSDDECEFQNADSCIYLVGNLSTNTYKFLTSSGTKAEEFDKGFSFYAPQTVSLKDGRTVMTAWMRSWAEPNLTLSEGWCGAMVLPRELTLKDNHIFQSPVREVYNYMKNAVTENDRSVTGTLDLPEFAGRTSRITLDIDVSSTDGGRAGIELYKGAGGSTKIYYDGEKGYLVFDRSDCGSLMSGKRYARVDAVDGKISLEIFLDINSAEVFINGGYYTMTGTSFAPEDYSGVALFAENCTANFSNLTKNDIIV